MPTSFFRVVYLRSSVLAGRCLPAVLTSTCGAIASTAGVGLSLPPVAPADVPALFHPRVGDIYLRWAEMFTCGAFGVYLRWFRLHSAGVSLCIPPVAPADVPALFHPRIGTFTCGATDNYLRCLVLFTYGLPSSQGGVYLRCFGCLPPVVSPPRRVYI